VRPLLADFETNSLKRKDRKRRLDEAVRLFGEAERETRQLLSALRKSGWKADRPHPNAQEVRVRILVGRSRAVFLCAPASNGPWSLRAVPQNKGEHKALVSVRRSRTQARLGSDLAAFNASVFVKDR